MADNLHTALAAIANTGTDPATTSAFAALVIGTDSIEAHAEENLVLARQLASLGNRLLTHAQRIGLPPMPAGMTPAPP